jgi:hypothetical protein
MPGVRAAQDKDSDACVAVLFSLAQSYEAALAE